MAEIISELRLMSIERMPNGSQFTVSIPAAIC